MKLTKNQTKIYQFLINHPGYLKKSLLSLRFNNSLTWLEGYSDYDIETALKQARLDKRNKVNNIPKYLKQTPLTDKDIYKHLKTRKKKTGLITKKQEYPGITTGKFKLPIKESYFNSNIKYDPNNVLFIADLHAPWILDGYIKWCKEQQEKYNCGTVIFSGDIIDSGAWSYHEHDPDGLGVKDELYAAKKQLKEVYKAFPEAIVLLGNHDLLISRKAKTAGLSQEFIRDLGTILETPKEWKFVHRYIKDNVQYIHGSVGDAFKRAVDSRMSTCQGHVHAKTFVQWSVSEKDAIFGLQVGGGFDRDKYAFDYAKPFAKKPIIGCGIILDKGTTPFVKLMPL